jgi:hypothetical protein
MLLAPGTGVTPNRVIAAAVSQATQRLEDPDQRQTLARSLVLIGEEKRVEMIAPRTDLRLRLLLS